MMDKSAIPVSDPAVPATPVVTKAPPPGKKFPCAKCGAKLDFDPSSRALVCPYCGHKEIIQPSKEKIEEQDYKHILTAIDAEQTVEGRSTQVTCAACNAVVLLEDKVVTDRCPYCGNHLENKPEAAQAMIAPQALVPFAINQRQAIGAYSAWIEGLWFAPGSLKKFANLGQLNGIYVPFWTFDSMTYTHYEGQRGDNYQETEYYTETDAQGNTVQRSRSVTKTRWTFVAGEVQHFFDDVLICASKSVPDSYARKVRPGELKSLEAFQPQFLSGFKTERYTIGPQESLEMAKKIMDGEIRRLCCAQIGGDQQQLTVVRTQHVGVTYKHILLPLWLASYRYYDKLYHIMVDGLTGRVQGDRPYSWIKILSLIGTILAVILLLWLVFSGKKTPKPTPVLRPAMIQVMSLNFVAPETRFARQDSAVRLSKGKKLWPKSPLAPNADSVFKCRLNWKTGQSVVPIAERNFGMKC